MSVGSVGTLKALFYSELTMFEGILDVKKARSKNELAFLGIKSNIS